MFYILYFYIDPTFTLKHAKDNHREKAPSNKSPALKKIIDMNIWVVGTLSQLFIRGSYTKTNFSKK